MWAAAEDPENIDAIEVKALDECQETQDPGPTSKTTWAQCLCDLSSSKVVWTRLSRSQE